MAKRITWIERLGPDCALGTDGVQWIVYRRSTAKSLPEWQGDYWAAAGFIQSSRRALKDCIEAKRLELSESGKAAIDRQDSKIYRWRRADGK